MIHDPENQDGPDLTDTAEKLGELLRWLAPDTCRTGASLRRTCGLRALTLIWVLRPDRMPWAAGRPQSAREVAARVGVHRNAIARLASEITRTFGIQNCYQTHGRTKRGGRVRSARTKDREPECVEYRCPHCGATMPTFEGKCPSCGRYPNWIRHPKRAR